MVHPTTNQTLAPVWNQMSFASQDYLKKYNLLIEDSRRGLSQLDSTTRILDMDRIRSLPKLKR